MHYVETVFRATGFSPVGGREHNGRGSAGWASAEGEHNGRVSVGGASVGNAGWADRWASWVRFTPKWRDPHVAPPGFDVGRGQLS